MTSIGCSGFNITNLQIQIDLKTLQNFTQVVIMCGGNDGCDHPHNDIPAKRAGEITRNMKILTDSIPNQKILVVSVLAWESCDTEISVLNTFLEKKFRRNFAQLHLQPEYKSYTDDTHYNEQTYHPILSLLLKKIINCSIRRLGLWGEDRLGLSKRDWDCLLAKKIGTMGRRNL